MTKKAFIVGINDYAPAGPGGQDLSGCVADAQDMSNTLVILGFPAENIRICTDKRATKKGIMDGLKWLTGKARKDDVLVFYYSGHGSQVTDFSGDEVDGKDEILCPHDTSFVDAVFIRDDALLQVFSKLPAGVTLEVILDSCHSGTATRDLPGIPSKTRSRYFKPPLDYTFHIDYEPDLKSRGLLKGNGKAIVPGLNHVLWAACKDNQTSEETEIDGSVRGVFTYNFCQVLRRANGDIARKQLYKLVNAAMKREKYSQTPQVEASSEGELGEKIFATADGRG
jgi:metacaspase-1